MANRRPSRIKINNRFYLFLFIMLMIFPAGNLRGEEIVIENRNIKRVISFTDNQFGTTGYYLPGLVFNFVSTPKEDPVDYKQLGPKRVGEFHIWGGKAPDEFSFLVNGRRVTGKTGWNLLNVKKENKEKCKTYVVKLRGCAEENRNICLAVTYALYEDYPIIRKKIDITNTGTEELKIESLDVECLNIPWGNTHNHIYNNYARYKNIGPFVGHWDDPLLIIQNPIYQLGYIVGNEAPGVLKRTSVCSDGRELSIGLTHAGDAYVFRSWLKQNESFESPWIFTSLFKSFNPREVVETDIADFVRKHMGIRLAAIKERPTFVYNTWEPFRRNINEKLVDELVDAAVTCGIEEFIIDDGWQSNFGDWEIDYKKFPNGLKPVFDRMKQKGVKPGLWMSMGAVSVDSKVYKEHPEWFVRSKKGKGVNLHTDNPHIISACFATEWKDFLKEKILKLVNEHGLEYLKLDFAIVTSAYRFDNKVAGCCAKDHPHKDREESYLKIYRAAWQLYDELHEQAPNLFIDCTFETMGKLQLIDFDMCKHAEGNWLTNFESPAPIGSLRIRHLGWWRSSVIPATAMVMGSQSLDDEQAIYSYKSLCGTIPIMLGDPRKMDAAKQKELRILSAWMRQMDKKHNIMLFRQDLPCFREPTYGYWDGFQRINTETGSGGIIGVFKHYSPINEQWITINYLKDDRIYKVVKAGSNEVIAEGSGADLRNKGFKLIFNNEFQGELYEVCLK